MATNNHGAISWPSQLQSAVLLSLTAAPSPPAPPPSPAPGLASRLLFGLHRAGRPPVQLEPLASPHKAHAWLAPQKPVAGALPLCAAAGEAGDLQETPPRKKRQRQGHGKSLYLCGAAHLTLPLHQAPHGLGS